MKKKIYGVGINDAKTPTSWYVGSGSNRKRIRCKIYTAWIDMLKRCYCTRYLEKYPTYIGCRVDERWHRFSDFYTWFCTHANGVDGLQLDKDIVFEGNKIYSPDTCCLVPPCVNYFILERTASRGECLLGVTKHKKANKFQARCRNPELGNEEHLGLFLTQEEAHCAWAERKLLHARALAGIIDNEIIGHALIRRYENIYSNAYKVLKESHNV